jgi:hypothetical protein
MTSRLLSQPQGWFVLLIGLLLSNSPRAFATDAQIKAQLIWGTDGDKPQGKDLKEVAPEVREKLRHLRWKNYWVVKAEVVGIKGKEVKRTVLSDKCAIDLTETADGRLEVKLFSLKPDGTSKLVKTVNHGFDALKKGEYVIVGGDDKERWDDAWMVIISCGKQP